MKYYSTNHQVQPVTLKEAVIKGLAADNGLFMPERVVKFDPGFFRWIDRLSFQEISFEVALKFFGDEIDPYTLKNIVYDTLSFDCPLVQVTGQIWSLELFHGPTMAFKDVGARFMARLLRYFLGKNDQTVNVLVATSGDTGSAVANGFLGVDGIRVFVLYPKGKVSEIQEKQFTTLYQNITAIEVDGTFDDCQALVKTAFLDEELNNLMLLTSANSINVVRFLPQAFYYFNAYARIMNQLGKNELVVAVPSGNFGNLTAGLFAREMGLPVSKFIAANNENDVVFQYLQTGFYQPRPSVETLANAMDVGTPSNFVRILDLYDKSWEKIKTVISGKRFSDEEISNTIQRVYAETGYVCDPHGACGYEALHTSLKAGQSGIFLETAHPAKFMETMEAILGSGKINLPPALAAFMKGEKQVISLGNQYEDFRDYLFSESRK